MVLGPAYAAAQTAATADTEALVLTASLAGGYDDDVSSGTAATPSTDPRFRAGGSFAMTDLSLSYGRQRRNINFGAAGNASIRSYRSVETFTADTYAGSAGMSATLAPRLRVGANASASRSSHFTLAILPVFAEDPVNPVEVPSMDYNLTAGELDRRHFGGQISYSPMRRSNISANYSVGESTAGERFLTLKSKAWGVGYSHGLTRNASLRLGYRRQQGTYGGSPRVPVDSYDVGINYSRPLSFSRRTTLLFSTGTAVVGTQDRRYGTVIGRATLNHRFSRAWNADISYNRAVGFIDGFEDPVLTDAVLSSLVGTVHRRVTIVNTLGYSNGNIGVRTASSSRYTTYTGGLRAQIALYRGFHAFAHYVYYHYQFKNTAFIPFGAPSRLNRQGIRGGIIYTVPLI